MLRLFLFGEFFFFASLALIVYCSQQYSQFFCSIWNAFISIDQCGFELIETGILMNRSNKKSLAPRATNWTRHTHLIFKSKQLSSLFCVCVLHPPLGSRMRWQTTPQHSASNKNINAILTALFSVWFGLVCCLYINQSIRLLWLWSIIWCFHFIFSYALPFCICECFVTTTCRNGGHCGAMVMAMATIMVTRLADSNGKPLPILILLYITRAGARTPYNTDE